MVKRFFQFWPILAKWPVLAVSRASPGQIPEKCYGHYGHLVFFTKVLWSRLWSAHGRYGHFVFPKAPPRPDHSDHNPTIGLTIALLLPNKRETIVTIALFWVLALGGPGHSQNGPFGQNGSI